MTIQETPHNVWVKLDDGFFRNRKARQAGRDGRALFIAGLCFCGGSLTDGHITTAELPIVAAEADVKASVAKTLVEVGLWHKVEDGWTVNDYHLYNRRSDDVRRERDAGRKRAAASYETRRSSSQNSSAEETSKNGAKNGRSFADSSPDQSSSSSSPPGVSSVSSSSSSKPAGGEEEDFGIILARQRLADRRGDTPIVNRRKWLADVADDVRSEYGAQAQRYLAEHPTATAHEIAHHLEPTHESTSDLLARIQARNGTE